MSYDLYVWKWASDSHISSGICHLLMAEGVECEDAAVLDWRKLKTRVARRLSPVARAADAVIQYEVFPRGLIVESHGMDPAALRESLEPVARQEGLVVYDPQVETVTKKEQSEAERLIQAEKGADELARLTDELPTLRARAEAGDAHALVELGNRFYFGEAIPKDLTAAFRYYLQAAESGDDAGMLNVASCYRRGEGVSPDIKTALRWYERALEIDRIFAPFELGEMYEKGDGVRRDLSQAQRYYSIALDGGHPDARKALRRIGSLPPPPTPFVRGAK